MIREELENKIKESAQNANVLRIKYTDVKDANSIRNVEPYEIKVDKLWAYCRKKKGIRQFDLNRIDNATVTKYPYYPKWPVKIGEDDEAFTKAASIRYYLDNINEKVFGSYSDAELE